MADNVTVDNATNGDYAVVTDEITSPYTGGTKQAQGVKLIDGTADSNTVVAAGGGVEANALRVTIASDSTGVVSVDDNGSTLSVDDGGSTISVDDGGSSLTVDGTVAVSGTVTVDSELTTGDLDTGAGTDTRAVVGLVGSKSGGGEIIPGDATNGLLVNLGANNDVTVTGTVTVDASGAAVPVTDNGGSLTVDGTVTANLAAGTNNIGDVDVLTVPAPLSTTGGGTEATALRVTLASDSTGVVSVDDNGGALTVDNGGTFAVQESGGALTSLQLIDDVIVADDAAFTPATTKVAMAGFEADESSTDSVDEGDAGAARMTLDRKQIVVNQPHSAGGCSIFRSLDIDETEEDVKTSAGTIYGWAVTNTATATRWLKFYNATAANTTVGTTTPVITWGIPGNSSDDVGANVMGGVGISFDTAICVAATTGVADNDTGAPGANDVIINVFYK